MQPRYKIKEFELMLGVKVIDPKGFRSKRNKIHTNLYTEKEFRRGIINSYISCKTEKGLEFLIRK